MADLKHIKTFETYSQSEVDGNEVNEELKIPKIKDLLDPRKSTIDEYLEKSAAGKKSKDINSVLTTAFAKTFGANPKLKDKVLGLDDDKKVQILKKASEVLNDTKVGPLKLYPKGETYDVGGIGTVAGTGGGRKG